MPRLRMRWAAPLGAALVLVASVGSGADFQVEQIASGLARPLFATAPPEDPTRLFVVEQWSGTTGRVRIVDLLTDSLVVAPFLSISPVSTQSEQGFLGMAFHPDYASNGFFFASYTESGGTLRIVRYQVSNDPDVADPTSATPVLSIAQPQGNHNGGWIGFGPDDLLYIATGDGGGSHDNDSGHTAGTGNAQDTTDNLLGKVLRIDVDADDFPGDPAANYAIPLDNPFVGVTGDDEIWIYGVRHPWRPSFDRITGDLYVADVGQGDWEEITVQPVSSPGGENYGWRLREGTQATPGGGGVGGPAPGAIDPIYEYAHGGGATQGFAVTGGYVYRGAAASIRGRYFFADFVTDRIWSLVWDGSAPTGNDGTNFTSFIDHTGTPEFTPAQGSLNGISSFGEDAAGNLYITTLDTSQNTGEVYRLTAAPPPVPAVSPLGGVLLALGLAGLGAAAFRRTPGRSSAQ